MRRTWERHPELAHWLHQDGDEADYPTMEPRQPSGVVEETRPRPWEVPRRWDVAADTDEDDP